MGFFKTPPYRVFEFGGAPISGNPVLTTTPQDIGPFAETLPSFEGSVAYAYLDFVPGTLKNTYAGDNALGPATSYIQIKKAGGSYINALKFLGDSLKTDEAGSKYCGRIYGNLNIESTISAGGTINWHMNDFRVYQNNITLLGGTYIVLRLYLKY